MQLYNLTGKSINYVGDIGDAGVRRVVVLSHGGACRGNVDALLVVARGAHRGVIGGGGRRTVGTWRLGVALEADVDGCPTVGTGRSTRGTAGLDWLVGLTDERLTIVTSTDCQRLLHQAPIWHRTITSTRENKLVLPQEFVLRYDTIR